LPPPLGAITSDMLFEEIVEVHDEAPHPAALNMAIDEVLLRHARMPLIRIYRWERPALSFGYFGIASEIVPASESREAVRRWTGGGVVTHGDDVTYSLIVPRASEFFRTRPLDSYAAIHKRIAALLPGAIVTGSPQPAAKSAFCFIAPSPHDIMRAGVKIGGAAQRRTRHGLLHQGSVQIAERKVCVRLPSALPKTLGHRVTPRELTERELEEATRLAAEKYATHAWLYRC